MEMLVSLSHEIRVEGQDAEAVKAAQPKVSSDQQNALDAQERQRLIDEYGVDTPKEEIDEKEKARIEAEEEKAEEAKKTIPEGLGQRKPIEDKDLTGSDIQNQHDLLNKI